MRAVLTGGWALLLGACQDFGIDPIDPEGPPPVQVSVTETFVQAALPAVDVLFVVDGTPSMLQELQALGAQVPELLDTLDGFGLDWQIGVVGADRSGPHPGWLLGAPYVLTPADSDPEGRFAERLPLGTALDEAGLAAGALALELSGPDGANAGFRRADASLAVVFVSDADDRSDPWTATPRQTFLDALAATASEGRSARAYGLVGDVPGGCASARGSAQPGIRYADVVQATGGRLHSICAIDFGALLEGLAEDSVTLPAVFPLADAPVPTTVRVLVDGQPEAAWTLGLEPPAILFDVPPPAGAVIAVSYVYRESASP